MAKGLKKAQQNALITDMINNAGVSKGAFRFNLTLLEEIVADFIENVKKDINSIEDFLVTGSIEELTVRVNSMNEVEILGLSHILYQSYGVNGTQDKSQMTPYSYSTLKPPIGVFREWIKAKQILTKNNSKFFKKQIFEEFDEDEAIESLAYAIREKVFRKGFKGHGYWQKNIDILKDDLNTKITQNLGEQIKYRIWDQYGNNLTNNL